MEQKEKNSKVISLVDMYWQIQKWLDKAQMGTVEHFVQISASGYSHYKKGVYATATLEPLLSISVHVNKTVICVMEKSPTIALEKTRVYIQSLKIQKENSDVIGDVTVDMPDLPEAQNNSNEQV